MSKQYLTVHTVEQAHHADIFSIAVTKDHILSASGGSALKVHAITATPSSESDTLFPLVQNLTGAHKLGCHHVVTSANGRRAASVGFGGEVRLWSLEEGRWEEEGLIQSPKAGEIWAPALSEDGQYLAATSIDGHLGVWDLNAHREKIRDFETKGSLGMAIDLSYDGRFMASGHQSGSTYIFSNETGRMLHSLPGLIKPIRAVAFSPASTLVAAAGDACIIALYDVASGEQVANLTGHNAWIFGLSFSSTGEYLLSCSHDGKVKVWSIETRQCVATQAESDKVVWSVKWLPKTAAMRNEMFVTAGANRSISVYREASGS